MPLKINSLRVSISVNQAKSEGGEGSSTPATELDAGKKANPEKIAQDVIEQVLRIIKDKKER
jgi:hypothetical protein